MKHHRLALLSASLLTIASGSPALAALTKSNTPAPGGFVQACAGPSTCGCGPWPGDDWFTVFIGGAEDKHESAFSGNSSASQSAAYSSANTSNTATGLAGMGYCKMSASNNFLSTDYFAQGSANGGWNELFTISNPAHTGQAGILQFTITVLGRLDASGVTGSAAISTTAYKDNIQLMSSPLASAGNSDLLSTDRQYGNWAIATYGNPNSDGKNVSGTVTYAVPFTFGTQFKLGVYVNCRAGQRSSGGFGTGCSSQVTLSQFSWGGISNIYFNGAPIGGSTVISGTGINWGAPVQPNTCPADINGDGVVDDTDFSLFAVAYNILDCADPAMPAGCPADINGDGFVDDSDFSGFVVAYNQLVCP